jgi:hypothetical protein
MPLITAALIAAGTTLAVEGGKAAVKGSRAKKQRLAGEKIAEDAMKRLDELDYQVGPQLGITQESRDLAEAQKIQAAESIKNLREQNLALAQQSIASGVMDPTRAGQTIANVAPSLSQQLAQSEFSAAKQATEADKRLADLAEGYSQANIAREQKVSDLNIGVDRALQEQLRREGQTAASLGYAAGTEAIQEGIGAFGSAVDTGLSLSGYGAPSGDNPYTAQQLGLKMIKKNGGMLNDQIYVTGGEFNHDTNKKALVDEETGEKEAELTGDEAVLNPEQTESTMAAFKILKDAVAKMQNPPKELLAALEKMSHFDEPQFQVPQVEIELE